MIHATLDFETYSEAGYYFDKRWYPIVKGKPGLKGVGMHVYAEHPTTDIICLSYRLPGGSVQTWEPVDGPLPEDLRLYVVARGPYSEAHNSMFEFLIWNYVGVRKYGFPTLNLSQIVCSAAKCRNWGLPGALEKAGKARSIPVLKEKRGKQLITLLSIPKQPTKKDKSLKRTRESHPELYVEMCGYCEGDVRAEESLSQRVPDMTEMEFAVWKLDQQINLRGVAVDTPNIKRLQTIVEWAYDKYNTELAVLTGGAVQAASETAKIQQWLVTQGIVTESVAKNFVQEMLDSPDVPEQCKQVLRIRQLISGAAAKKLWAIEARTSFDGTLKGLFIYCGAERTGRFSGSGVQPQNLKSGGPECFTCNSCGGYSVVSDTILCPRCRQGVLGPEKHEWGHETTKAFLADVEQQVPPATLEQYWSNLVDVAGASMRGMFISRPGYEFICSDYSAIEAVTIACLAGEQWQIDVFKGHGKIYEATAEMITGVPVDEMLTHKKQTGKHHPYRKIGKVGSLASSYAGWIGAWKNFGADKFMSDDEIKNNVIKWRDRSPMIVEFWGGQWRIERNERGKIVNKTQEYFGLEGAAISAMLAPGHTYGYRDIQYVYDNSADVLYCRLPSGRYLSYHYPRLTTGENRQCFEMEYKLSYKAWNTNPQMGPIGWVDISTYGGKLAENVTQATAGEILKYAMLRVDKAGYPIVLHVHDEIVAEVPAGTGSIEEFEALMAVMPDWAKDWPIRASGGWRGRRYRK